MPALLIYLQADWWIEYVGRFSGGFLIGTAGGFTIVGANALGLLT